LNLATLSASPSSSRIPNIQSPILEAVLESFLKLLPLYPTTFRPYTTQLVQLLHHLIAPTPSQLYGKDAEDELRLANTLVPAVIKNNAQRLFVLLHHCAPRNHFGDDWMKQVLVLVKDAHRTADQVFRSMREDYQSTIPEMQSEGSNPNDYGNVVSEAKTTLELPSWRGIQAGIERLVGLLGVLGQYIACESSSAVSLPVGVIQDLLARLFSVTVPLNPDSDSWKGIINPAVDRQERDGLWQGLPQVHIAAISVLSKLEQRLSLSMMALSEISVNQLLWIFEAESNNE
jgi:hypothetical protein